MTNQRKEKRSRKRIDLLQQILSCVRLPQQHNSRLGLLDHTKLINDSNVNLVFHYQHEKKERQHFERPYMNRRRKEDQRIFANSPKYFYIGNMEAAINKLNQSQLYHNKIKIGNKAY